MLKQVLLNVLAVIAQSSIPEIGSSSRYRAAPRNSMLAIVPVDGAEFIPNQRFDVSIELHDLEQAAPDISSLQFTINGQPADLLLGKKYEVRESWNFTYAKTLKALDSKDMTRVFVSRIAIRSGKLEKSGKYNVRVSIGGHSLSAEWVVRATQPRSAKNLILMIGDGMASSMITAARTISKTTRFGKFNNNVLNLEKLGGSIGKIMTNGIDSIMTDSANSAAAYNTGQKGWSSGLNVYSDTSESTLDDPKVESIAEYIRSYRSNMCIGIVTTAEVQDATPAAVFAHTRNRDDKDVVTDQALNGFSHNNLTWDPKPVKSDVLFGGGGAYYCTKAPNCKSLNQRNFYDEFRKSGYAVVNSKDELMSYDGKDPILGIFNGRVMDTWIDRNLYPESLSSKGDPFGANQKAPSQPSLEQMTMKAIDVLNGRCNDGFFLMVEAASIDKAMHNIDYDRGLAELLELDRTVKVVNDWRLENQHLFETAVIVTSDHAQSFDVSGVVDTEYLAELPEQDTISGVTLTGKNADLQYFKRRALGIYDYAGFPDLVTDSSGMPTNWEGRYRLWSGKVDAMQHKEDFKIKKKYRESTIEDKKLSAAFGSSVYVMNPEESGVYYAPVGNSYYEKTGHSLQAVDLYCAGPHAFTTQCAKVMDNTELFFIMANTLGLGNDAEMAKMEEEKKDVVATTVYVEKTLTVYLAAPTVQAYKRDLSGDTGFRAQFFSLILLVTIFSI